jgi:hypothetical protein
MPYSIHLLFYKGSRGAARKMPLETHPEAVKGNSQKVSELLRNKNEAEGSVFSSRKKKSTGALNSMAEANLLTNPMLSEIDYCCSGEGGQ